MRKLIILSVFIVMLYNCSDINDTHQDFLDRGERIYVGRADTLVVLGGYERARIQGMMYYANSAEKCIIRWTTEGKKDSVVVQAAEWKANNDTLSVLIEGLTEGTQRFFVQTYDKEGNKSLNLECSGTIYGEQYILSATPKFKIGRAHV